MKEKVKVLNFTFKTEAYWMAIISFVPLLAGLITALLYGLMK